MKQNEKLEVLNIDTSLYKTRISKKFRNRKPYEAADPHMIISFISGTVLDIIVKPGQIVKQGDDLMILDSMKMQNQLKCSIDGKIKNIPVKKGDKVSKGTVLLELE
ncbi:MAG: acetyl-CoA carboxylase biotin carboxyl carrier protein subunit [Bacteroidales bacterium]|jgi:biotin carboxyl carrier protein|nr:acetyl-CoA carboxylase biotin carboxyl carrier protein subunit [Bacteroidales bacterium]